MKREHHSLRDGSTLKFRGRAARLTAQQRLEKLRTEGQLHWTECAEHAPSARFGGSRMHVLTCPLCVDHPILLRQDLSVPTQSAFVPCPGCGLTGTGFTLELVTSRKA
jgi:hypothetical protein